MEIQLQELIEQIKKNGVEVAENEAAAILDAANAEAKRIIADAKEEAGKIISQAKEENSRLVAVSEEAIRQAGRNLLLSFRESVAKELEAVSGAEISAAYSPEALAGLIVSAIEAWTKNTDTDDISVLLNSRDIEALEKNMLSALKEQMSKGVTLKADDSFDGGFRISLNGGSLYYDYSAEAVCEMLSSYLNPRVTALLKEAGKA